MTRKISDFSAEVLAEYIKHNYFTPEEEVVKKLIYREARLEYDQIQKKIDAIVYAKTKPISDDPKKRIKDIQRFLSDREKLDALRKRQEKLSRIMFPDYYAKKEEKPTTPNQTNNTERK